MSARRTNANNNNNNYNESMAAWSRVQNRSPRWRAQPSNRNGMPVLGEVRLHTRTGIMYVYELYKKHPRGKERAGWLRYDTWVWKALGRFPNRFARPKDLRKFDRKTLGLPAAPATFVQLQFR